MPTLTVAQAVQAFTANPGSFLRNNYVGIGSSNKAQAGVCTFNIMDNATAYGFTNKWTKNKKKRQFWKIYWRSNGANALAADEFEAHYIPMLQTNNAQYYALPSSALSNCGLMITSQLTGCSFGLGSDANGTRLVTHIQPDKTVLAANRDTDLQQAVNGVFANLILDYTHARQPGGYDGSSTVVGHRVNDVWSFFMQNQGNTMASVKTHQDGMKQKIMVNCPYLQGVLVID